MQKILQFLRLIRFVLLRVRNSHPDNNTQNGEDKEADDEFHLHILPPHFLSKIIRTSLENSSLLLEFLGNLFNRLKFHTVLQSYIYVVLHHKPDRIDFSRYSGQFIHILKIVILKADFLKQCRTRRGK